MKIRRTWVALTAVGALGVGALSLPAFAQDDDGPNTEEEAPGSAEAPESETAREGLRAQIKERAKEIFAAELGVTVEELEAARQATREQIQEEFADEFEARREQRQARMLERVDRALDNGRITEEEAEVLRERIESGEPPFGGLGRGFHRGQRGFGGMGGPGGMGGADGALFDGAPSLEGLTTGDG